MVSYLFIFQPKFCVHFYIPLPSGPTWDNNIWWRVQIMNLLVAQFSSAPFESNFSREVSWYVTSRNAETRFSSQQLFLIREVPGRIPGRVPHEIFDSFFAGRPKDFTLGRPLPFTFTLFPVNQQPPSYLMLDNLCSWESLVKLTRKQMYHVSTWTVP